MNETNNPPTTKRRVFKDKGQAIVVIAGALVAILAFVGLAIDLGVIWFRQAQLTAAVDSAVLSGATVLTNGIDEADKRAIKFLATNEIPTEEIFTFDSSQATTVIGARQYSITVTWNVPTNFMRVVGFTDVNVTRSATAAYFPLVDIYASRRVEDGVIQTSNQAVFGPQQCVTYGDAFSPSNSPYKEDGIFKDQKVGNFFEFRYRIAIPPDYPYDVVRVELFDPDSINNNDPTQILHTNTYFQWLQTSDPSVTSPYGDTITGGNLANAYVVPTNEWADNSSTGSPFELDEINPFWFVRVDEIRNPNCSGTSTSVQNATQTVYELYYFRENANGSIDEVPLASYTGLTGDNSRDRDPIGPNHASTDLLWVSPGAFNKGLVVPTDCGSANGGYAATNGRCGNDPNVAERDPSTDPNVQGRGFEVSLSQDAGGIVTDRVNGYRYLYMSVTAISGASENGFEIWAGPPDYSPPLNANSRNVQAVNNQGSTDRRTSAGVTVYGIGILPMNSNTSNRVQIPLTYVSGDYAGQQVFISMFDSDSGARPPITFYFDSISRNDYEITYGEAGVADPDGLTRCFDLDANNCNGRWVGAPGWQPGNPGNHSPPYVVDVPNLSPACVPGTSPVVECTPFYGGRLMVDYQGGTNDTYQWVIILPSLPYLVK